MADTHQKMMDEFREACECAVSVSPDAQFTIEAAIEEIKFQYQCEAKAHPDDDPDDTPIPKEAIPMLLNAAATLALGAEIRRFRWEYEKHE